MMKRCGRLILVIDMSAPKLPATSSLLPYGEKVRMRGQPTKSRPQQLRTNATDVEQKLWYFLRNRQFENFKFRRQHPIGVYVVDFVCLERKLIVELDGGQHAENTPYDARRTKTLHENGFRILRFWNNDVLQNTDGVLETIFAAISASPSPLPSPRDGARG